MKQRLGFAMALFREPRLLVLDEPTHRARSAGVEEIRGLPAALAAAMQEVLVMRTAPAGALVFGLPGAPRPVRAGRCRRRGGVRAGRGVAIGAVGTGVFADSGAITTGTVAVLVAAAVALTVLTIAAATARLDRQDIR
jgi:hypothetical protein